jgi:hypothetical protein
MSGDVIFVAVYVAAIPTLTRSGLAKEPGLESDIDKALSNANKVSKHDVD